MLYNCKCSFGIVSIRDCIHSGLCPFGMVSIRDCVHSGSCFSGSCAGSIFSSSSMSMPVRFCFLAGSRNIFQFLNYCILIGTHYYQLTMVKQNHLFTAYPCEKRYIIFISHQHLTGKSY